jgi:tripartite ATP-independent transporter DctP family solute receptor
MSLRLGLLPAASALLALTSIEAHAQQIRLRASGSFPAGHSTSKAMEVFKKEVARLSNDTIRVDLFPGNTLGGAFEQVDQIRTGQIQMAWGAPSFYDKLVPELSAVVLPFAASNSEQAACQLNSEFGKFVERKVEEKGLIVLGWGPIGARHVTNNRRPIKTVDDLKGLKIRVLPGDAWRLTFEAVGANPTPLDIAELYQALQQGVVDGQENPYDNMLVRKFHQVQKYVSNTGHFFDWSGFYMHKPTFDSMTPEQQKAMSDAMAAAMKVQREISDKGNSEALAGLIKGGMQYDEIPKQELDKFREATRPVYTAMRERYGNELMDLAEKAIKNCP